MDEFTKEHLLAWVIRYVPNDHRWMFVSFSIDILNDPEDLAYYMREGWQRLYDRYYDERLLNNA